MDCASSLDKKKLERVEQSFLTDSTKSTGATDWCRTFSLNVSDKFRMMSEVSDDCYDDDKV